MAQLFPNAKLQFDTVLGTPLVGGKLYTYDTGTNTPRTTWQDKAGTVPNTNPIILDVRGECTAYGSGNYKFVLKDALDNLIWTQDNVQGSGEEALTALLAFEAALAAASGSTLMGFLQAGTGAVARTAQSKMREMISVTDFGAVGDGSANDTLAISNANTAAALLGKSLFFPAGTYLTDPQSATTNWYGEKGSLIKNRGNQTGTIVSLVTATGVDNITFDGLAFDGNVSADPSPWNSSNYDSFTGSAGLSVENCSGATVRNCRSQNTRQHGFRFVACQNAAWERCSTKRSRGNFGDGFIAVSCVGLIGESLVAQDYTRIGIVVDSYGTPLLTGYKIALSKCYAFNGHDASILYGGTEYNSSIWVENSADVSIDQCFGWSNVHYNIYVTTGVKNNGFAGGHSNVSITNSHTVGGSFGIYVSSLSAFPVMAKVVGCSAKQARLAFIGVANAPTDSFVWLGCHAEYDASTTNGRGFATNTSSPTGKPIFLVGDGCTITRSAENLTYLRDQTGTQNTADIGGDFGPAGAMALTVQGVSVTTPGPVYIKFDGHAVAHDFIASYVDISVPYGGSTGGEIHVTAAKLHTCILTNGTAAFARISSCQIVEQVTVSAVEGSFASNRVNITSTDYVWLLSTSVSNFPAWEVEGNRFSKPINANDQVLRLSFGATTWQVIMENNKFYNNGAASAAKPFIRYAAGTGSTLNGNYSDNNVTNIFDLDTGGGPSSPAGFTKIAMH